MTTMDATGNTTKAEKRVGDLKAILYLLQSNLEGFKDEVDRSYSLLQIGEKTSLTQSIEKLLNNPIEGVFEMSSKIDDQVKYIVDKFVKAYLIENVQIVQSAYRSRTTYNDLHYSIVLKNDDMESRMKVFEFLDKYDSLEIADKYPVYFQFVPIELVGKINYNEEIKLQQA